MGLREIFSNERKLKMVWKVEKDGRRSYLAGTAHFFPYSFKNSLRGYISKVDTVLLEGPLDENAMAKVISEGITAEGKESFSDSLDRETMAGIEREIARPLPTLSAFSFYTGLSRGSSEVPLWQELRGKRPWMVFFALWAQYRERWGWNFTMDLDALKIAEQSGKDIHFLEKIEEQIEAMDGIPPERIIRYLKEVRHWRKYTRQYVKCYLKGDLEKLMALTGNFPTRCESIVDRRDPILYERMKPFLEKGNAIAIVGITHIRGISGLLRRDGYTVEPC